MDNNILKGNYEALLKQNKDLQAELLETKRLLNIANKKILEMTGE